MMATARNNTISSRWYKIRMFKMLTCKIRTCKIPTFKTSNLVTPSQSTQRLRLCNLSTKLKVCYLITPPRVSSKRIPATPLRASNQYTIALSHNHLLMRLKERTGRRKKRSR